jgi:hypothetical protein
MDVSQNGVPILRGSGLAAVHKKIQDEFSAARTTPPPHVESDSTDIPPDIQFLDESLFENAPDVELVEIPELSLASACDMAASAHQSAVIDDCFEAWTVELPTENAGTIIEQACRELGEGPL